MKHFALAWLIWWCSGAWALDSYYCDCQSGAHPSCVPGNNANAGTSAAAPKQTLDGEEFFTSAPGDRFRFCEGAVFTYSTGPQFEAPFLNPANPIVLEPYSPPSGATGRPILRQSGSGQGLTFGGTFASTLHGGYLVRGLRLEGGATGNWGVLVNSATVALTLDDMQITGWNIGVHVTTFNVSSNGAPMIRDMVIRRSAVDYNRDMGFLGGSTRMLIENSSFSYNNEGDEVSSSFSHGIYLGCNNLDCSNSIIRNNLFERNSVPEGLAYCAGGNLTIHGHLDGLLLEGNRILADSASGSCAGISLTAGYDSTDEAFLRTVIRGNRIVNVGACAICTNSAPGLVMENNVIVHTHAGSQSAILLNAFGGSETPQVNNVIRNNTCYLLAPGAGSSCFSINHQSGHTVVGNKAYIGPSATNSHRCFEVGAVGSYALFARNLCHSAGSNGTWSQTHASLAAAQAAGFDAGGLAADPLFASTPSDPWTWSCNVQSGSPAIDAAGAGAARLAFGGWLANGPRDIGACEFGSTP